MSSAVIIPRPAATVILVREHDGLEVLMVERTTHGFFGGLTVFPGGGIDECDASVLANRVVAGSQPDHIFRAAALRELAEETGIAITIGGLAPAPRAKGAELFNALESLGLQLDGDVLTLVSRWVTPPFAPKRYDTRFYVAAVSGDPLLSLDDAELVSSAWLTPAAALSMERAGTRRMFSPTIAHLKWLERHRSVEGALESARGAHGRTLVEPETHDDGSLVPTAIPADET